MAPEDEERARPREAMGPERWVVAAAAAAVFATVAVLSLARFHTFHNETFDLAFYARMAWGMPRGSFWDPIVGANVAGLHLSPILIPLGVLGMVFGVVPVLLVAQALAVALAAWPFARMGERRFGRWGAVAGGLVWLLYPNLVHVGSYEMHPGTLAVLPLAWACDAADRRDGRALLWAVFGVLLCREDLALCTGMLCLLGVRGEATAFRTACRRGAAISFGWALLFLLVLHPIFAPAHGSMQDHFGHFGDSAAGAALHALTHPGDLFAHLAEGERTLYLVRLLWPLAFLPLLRPRWLVGALPLLAINLLSQWPTTVAIDSHYQTGLLPFLVAAALDGGAVAARRVPRGAVLGGLVAAVAVGHALHGGSPLSKDFSMAPFTPDAHTRDAAAVVARIPADASVQAPYPLMPHLAEREDIRRAPPPDKNTEFVVLDTWYRREYAHDEDLIRTTEEPVVRDWLARDEMGLVAVSGDYLVLRRGADPRAMIAPRYVVGTADPEAGDRLAACLGILGGELEDGAVALELVARGPCPADLALRIGTGARPTRVDLLFDGLLSPAHLRRGDRLRSVHALSADERAAIQRGGLRVGLLRQSGTRPEHADPVAVDVELSR